LVAGIFKQIINYKPLIMKKLQINLLIAVGLITLTILSCKKKDNDTPTPTPAPVASFTVTNGGCIGPCTVTFTNTSQNATSYSWDFGDGSSVSTAVSPTHQYTLAGTYTVRLTATGAGGTNSATSNVVISAPQYYITFDADNVPVSFTDISAVRNTTASPRTLTISGTQAAGANPKFKFFSEETFIGFVSGLNVGCSSSTTPSDYIEYTNATGTLHSTANASDGISVFFSQMSYTNGGEAQGTFSGNIKTSGGTVVAITNGAFKVKFSN
jgi:PKD repeat protein